MGALALLALCATCAVAAAQHQVVTGITSQQNATQSGLPRYNYNSTGLFDSRVYYGDYNDTRTTVSPSSSRPEPYVEASLAPPGCNIFKQFAVGNYSGPYTCQIAPTPDTVQAQSILPPCVDLSGKVALITGASTGIGRATADRLYAAGMQVIGTSRYPWRYPEPDWHLAQLDQTSDDSVKQLIDLVATVYGHIDLLYLNAGRQFVGDLANSDMRQMELTIQTNFFGALRVMQAALPLLPKTGYARIFQTSSVESQLSSPGYLPYAVSKWALMALQESWYSTHAGENVTTNIEYISIMPGAVNTSLGYTMIYGCPELAFSQRNATIDAYRTNGLSPNDVAEAVYRVAIDPRPRLRYLVMRDDNWKTYIPVFCRRYTMALEDFYVNTPGGPDLTGFQMGEAKAHKPFNCSAHCGGLQFCGAGPPGSGVQGTHSIVAY